jgi:hypothetical protein
MITVTREDPLLNTTDYHVGPKQTKVEQFAELMIQHCGCWAFHRRYKSLCVFIYVVFEVKMN